MILSHGQNHKQNPAQNHGQGPGQNITSKLQKLKILFCRFMQRTLELLEWKLLDNFSKSITNVVSKDT